MWACHMIGIAKRGLLPLEIPILPVGSAGLPLGEVVADVRRALHPGPVAMDRWEQAAWNRIRDGR